MMKKALAKHSKFYALGPDAQKVAIRMRAEGKTYEDITKYLNEHYPTELSDKPLTLLNTYQFFKKHGNTTVSRIKQDGLEKISKEINNTSSLKNLLNYLDETIKYYQEKGERLKLRDAINAKLRIHELLMKEENTTEKDKQSDELKNFLNKVQNEFNTPSITAEIEYDAQGNIRKKTMTKKIRTRDEKGRIHWVDEDEINNETEEEINEESNETEEVPINNTD